MTPQPDSSVSQPSGTPTGTVGIDLREYLIPLVVVIFVTVFLWLISLYNFALYHTTVEFTTIAISVAIFLLVWKSRKIIDNNYLLFIGVAFVFIAILDYLHTLVYQGVGIFPDGGGTLSTRFWIAARYMQAITLLVAPLFIRRNLRLDLVAIVYLVADIIIISSIFVFRVFPATYIEGLGLTPFKIVSEYVISLLLIASVVLLYRNRDAFDRQVLNNLAIAIFLTIAAELTFTEYASFVDVFSLLGHVFRLLSFYFFYRAIIEVGQEKPYNLLYHNLTESEKKYRALSELSPDAIIVTRDGLIRYVNGAGLLMFEGSGTDSIIGKDFMDFIDPDDRAVSAIRITSVQEEMGNAPLRELRVIAGGKSIMAEATEGPISWDGKDAVQIVIRDITKRKIVEEENLRAREEWERTFDTVPDLIAILDTNHRIIRANKAIADRLGTLPEKCIGNLCYETVHGTSVPPEFCPHAKTCTDGKQHICEMDEPALGGTFIVSTTPLSGPEGNLIGTVHVAHDITDRKRAEAELLEKNRALNTANEELFEIHEKLKATNEDLVANEHLLVVRNEELTSLNEELTAAQEELHRHVGELNRREEELRQNESRLKDALAEKEILLSEIHHRVKNNLTAFISLLSLDGTYEKTDAGQALRKDLQNRARSMALIHETLYRTGRFSSVDMDVYLTTLIGQVAGSYAGNIPVRTLVDAKGVVLDLARATTAGLIINELVTNSFKYAFPPGFDCMAVRKEPCTVRVMLAREEGTYCLRVSDNGCGMSPKIDIASTRSLGLKLVNFLARHQLRADIEISTEQGTEFIFRLHTINEDT
ncbi:MASE3 domain-containing protein [Methanoregula sp.]|uniref:MASE3 domain-containing protein n=1 Tax=Methanoregula sp. TaxID=2052170 RepID=UPI00236E0BE8|nr:MASE3 domain-containing protein [Methanoregula sp.]MDD1686029.1 PAS domain S-box protein [Methanoregula sp.]